MSPPSLRDIAIVVGSTIGVIATLLILFVLMENVNL